MPKTLSNPAADLMNRVCSCFSREAFVSGWGLLSDMRCTTDSGPSRHKRCYNEIPFFPVNEREANNP